MNNEAADTGRIIRAQLRDAVERAVCAAEQAYQFSPNSYTAAVLGEVVRLQNLIR
jgi:hypothetical protein